MKHAIIAFLAAIASISYAELPDTLKDPATRDVVEYLDAKVNYVTPSTATISANGYATMPGGLIIQWGKYTGGANSPTVTFPKSFASLYFITATIEGTVGQNGAMVEVHTVGNTSFVGNQRRHDATSLTSNFWWLAIGQ